MYLDIIAAALEGSCFSHFWLSWTTFFYVTWEFVVVKKLIIYVPLVFEFYFRRRSLSCKFKVKSQGYDFLASKVSKPWKTFVQNQKLFICRFWLIRYMQSFGVYKKVLAPITPCGIYTIVKINFLRMIGGGAHASTNQVL